MTSSPLSPYLRDFERLADLETSVNSLLSSHGQEATFHHVKAVAQKAAELAERFSGNVEEVSAAAWLHDISAIIPNRERIAVAQGLRLEVLPEEADFPMIIHQKLSAALAEEAFGVTSQAVLSAISCHTTLKANASKSDHIVFVADKIAWDQAGTPPYLPDLLVALEASIEAASLVYLDYLWEMRARLKVLHPWAKAAREALRADVSKLQTDKSLRF